MPCGAKRWRHWQGVRPTCRRAGRGGATSPAALPLSVAPHRPHVPDAYRPPSSFSLFPPVVKNLLIINALVFLAQQIPSIAGYLDVYGMLWPAGSPRVFPTADGLAAVPRFYPWQLVTSAFMHGSLGHIFFNMFGLWMFGGTVERELGTKRFLIFYGVCVLGASLLQLGVASAPYVLGELGARPIPTLGASGGVLGVLAAFGVLHPDSPIYLFLIPVPIPAKWFVLGYAAFSVFAGFSGVQAGVAHFAHLGGMVAGAILIWYWRGRLPLRPRTRLA